MKILNERLCRLTRHKNPVIRYWYDEYLADYYAYITKVVERCEPESYAEVTQDTEWQSAMEEEMHVLAKNETWGWVDLPKIVQFINCSWVFKVKYNVDGFFNRYKAGSVGRGLCTNTRHELWWDLRIGSEDDYGPCAVSSFRRKGDSYT